MPVLCRLAVRGLAPVRAVFDHAGLGEPVHFGADLSGTQPAAVARHQRFAAVFVDDVVAMEPNVLVHDVAVVVIKRDRALGRFLVLERRSSLRTVAKPETSLIGFVVLEVDRPETPEADPRVPEDRYDDVVPARALVPLEVADDLVRALGVEQFVASLLAAVDVRELHALAHPGFHGVDRRAELEEHAQRRELPAKRDDVHVLLSPDAVPVEVPPGEVVEVVDPDLVAPLDEGVEPVLVVLERLLADLEFTVRDVEVDRLAWRNRLEIVAHASTSPSSD